MNALNEVNKVIAGVSYYPHRHTTGIDPEGEWLTPERMAVCIFYNFLYVLVNLMFDFLTISHSPFLLKFGTQLYFLLQYNITNCKKQLKYWKCQILNAYA